jgi:hypothetical protein
MATVIMFSGCIYLKTPEKWQIVFKTENKMKEIVSIIDYYKDSKKNSKINIFDEKINFRNPIVKVHNVFNRNPFAHVRELLTKRDYHTLYKKIKSKEEELLK